MAPEEHEIYQRLIFEDRSQIRTLNAQTAEEAREILEYIRTNGYTLIAIEGKPWVMTRRSGNDDR